MQPVATQFAPSDSANRIKSWTSESCFECASHALRILFAATRSAPRCNSRDAKPISAMLLLGRGSRCTALHRPRMMPRAEATVGVWALHRGATEGDETDYLLICLPGAEGIATCCNGRRRIPFNHRLPGLVSRKVIT